MGVAKESDRTQQLNNNNKILNSIMSAKTLFLIKVILTGTLGLGLGHIFGWGTHTVQATAHSSMYIFSSC